MAQIFPESANSLARVSIVGGAIVFVVVVAALAAIYRSPFVTQVNVPREQPVPFSHEHHVDVLGIDCRYCHNSVETASFAGLPSTETCMTCHSQIWTDAPMLEPVIESYETGEPIKWVRVNDLPDFVYFDHGIHVQKGISCVECHGRVDQMPLTWKTETLHMSWCLECHRRPEEFIRPREHVFTMDWDGGEELVMGEELVREYNIRKEQLTNCTICHR